MQGVRRCWRNRSQFLERLHVVRLLCRAGARTSRAPIQTGAERLNGGIKYEGCRTVSSAKG
jgi:hypothetical protein